MNVISWLDNLIKNPQTLLHLFEIISNMTGQKEIKEALKKANEAAKKGDMDAVKDALGGFDVDSFVDEVYYQNALATFNKEEQDQIDELMGELKKVYPEIHRNTIAAIATNEEVKRKNMLERILSCTDPQKLANLAIARGWDRPDSPKTYEKILGLLADQKENFDSAKKVVGKKVKDAQKAVNGFVKSYKKTVNKPLEDILNKLKKPVKE